MSVLQMKKVAICGLKKDRKAILEALQKLGVVQIVHDQPEEGLSRMDTLGAKTGFERNVTLTEQALEILDTYAPEKASLLSGLAGKEEITQEEFKKTVSHPDKTVDRAGEIVRASRAIAENDAQKAKLTAQIEQLRPWEQMGIPLNTTGTEKTAAIIGTMPAETTVDAVYQMIQPALPEGGAVNCDIIHQDTDALYLAVVCRREDARAVEDALRAGGFVRPSVTTHRTPAQKIEELQKQITSLDEKNEKQKVFIEGAAKYREELRRCGDFFRMRADKYDVLGTLNQSKSAFFVDGYVPAKAAPAVEKAIGEQFDALVEISDVAEDDENVPVILKNNKFSETMEGVVASYGLPDKKDVDPTTIMSFFYVFFFGMMLSDAAYGAIIAIACFIVLKKFPRMSNSMRKSIRMFMYCGISTIVWGVLFGGYFGDVVQVVSRTFFGKEVKIPALWFEPINDPMRLLLYSMLFGVIHLFTGLGIKGYMLLRDKKVKDFVCDVVFWFMLLVGLILMLLPSDIFNSISQLGLDFPPALDLFAKILTIAGALGIVLFSGRSNKNPALRVALGAYDLYNVTGWLSDVLSYSRLLALGLATGVIASVINQMGSMLGKSVAGVIVFVIVFIAGHILNMAINILGAYVHTNRLQYVEFFGKFYESGGKAFEPFSANTKYVDVKEE